MKDSHIKAEPHSMPSQLQKRYAAKLERLASLMNYKQMNSYEKESRM